MLLRPVRARNRSYMPTRRIPDGDWASELDTDRADAALPRPADSSTYAASGSLPMIHDRLAVSTRSGPRPSAPQSWMEPLPNQEVNGHMEPSRVALSWQLGPTRRSPSAGTTRWRCCWRNGPVTPHH